MTWQTYGQIGRVRVHLRCATTTEAGQQWSWFGGPGDAHACERCPRCGYPLGEHPPDPRGLVDE